VSQAQITTKKVRRAVVLKGCPSEDPFYDLNPIDFFCSVCDAEFTIFSDELANSYHKCHKCGSRIVEVALMYDERIPQLLAFAKSLGVSDAKLLRVDRIVVDDGFRSHCQEPRCPNYDTSVNCPPHSMTPGEFRDHLKDYVHVLAFKFDMPAEALNGAGRPEAGLLLHETTAAIEHYAVSLGFERARGYSSGGCKKTLCFEHANCEALQEGGQCRHPDKARPSLSGMGVNWHELSKSLGWMMLKNEDGDSNTTAETIMMAGLVLLE